MREKPVRPLLYHRTPEQIRAWQKVPVAQKLEWLEMQMEFYYYAMPEESKAFRDRLMDGKR